MLIECKECKNSVSDQADHCPKCGCPVRELECASKITKNDVFSIAIAVFFATVVSTIRRYIKVIKVLRSPTLMLARSEYWVGMIGTTVIGWLLMELLGRISSMPIGFWPVMSGIISVVCSIITFRICAQRLNDMRSGKNALIIHTLFMPYIMFYILIVFRQYLEYDSFFHNLVDGFWGESGYLFPSTFSCISFLLEVLSERSNSFSGQTALAACVIYTAIWLYLGIRKGTRVTLAQADENNATIGE